MNTQWIKTRQTKYTAYVSLYIAIIIAVLFMANFLANRYNKPFDSTSNKRFSLSDQTVKVVKGLKKDVEIEYFDQTNRFGQARDLLDRYGNLSPSLKVAYIDPDKKPTLARAAGVRTAGTIIVKAGAKTQEAKSLTEEEVTSALIRVLKGGERNVCFVAGSDEHKIDDAGRTGYSGLKDALERNNYKTRSVNLIAGQAAATPVTPAAGSTAPPAAQKPEVPKDCTILAVAGPRFDYVQPEIDAIKAYVEGGGRAIFFVDPPVKLGRDEISENQPLVNLLGGWGVTLNKDLVLDVSGVGQLFGLSEVVPLVVSYETANPIVREMKEVATAFPLTRSLEVKNGDKTSVDKLFSSSDNSYATSNLSSAEIRINPARDKKGPLVLGAAGTYNPGASGTPGRFVVVGSSNWVANNILRFNGNRDLALNMFNWLSSDEDLISIRPKQPDDRRLTLTMRQMNVVFYSSVVFLPLLIVVAGVGVWWRRR